MNPKTASQQQGDPRSEALTSPAGILLGSGPAKVSGEQGLVLECLRKEGGGLTARQIQSRLACTSTVVENALAVLLERQLISRLNTLVPSYVYRLRGAVADDG